MLVKGGHRCIFQTMILLAKHKAMTCTSHHINIKSAMKFYTPQQCITYPRTYLIKYLLWKAHISEVCPIVLEYASGLNNNLIPNRSQQWMVLNREQHLKKSWYKLKLVWLNDNTCNYSLRDRQSTTFRQKALWNGIQEGFIIIYAHKGR